jgi:enoyl-CoA hydratase/carnithine racemase
MMACDVIFGSSDFKIVDQHAQYVLVPGWGGSERFPRIVGLRDGRLAFDLPAARVTRDHLARLYAQHEHELLGATPGPEAMASAPAVPAAPAVMHCR